MVVLVVGAEEETVVEVEVETGVVLDHMIPLHATSAGCMAIWPVTAPKPATSRWEVAQATLPVEHLSNLGKKAHSVAEEGVGKSGSLASMFCMMMTVTPTPLMKQDNCMCHWTLGKLLPSQLRWKLKMK